jgi:hypothetical protein
MAQNPAPAVERKIYFYRADIGVAESGESLAFDPRPALNAVLNLIATQDWYYEEGDGNALCLLPAGERDAYPVARFCRVRRVGLPQLEQAGRVEDMNLAEDQGLLESVHVVFLPDNVIGAEYNHYGPRVSRLGQYLHVKSAGGVERASINPIIRKTVADQLDQLVDLHSLEINIVPSTAEIVRQAHQPLGNALRALAGISGSPGSIHLIYRPTSNTESSFLTSMIAPLKFLTENINFLGGAKKLKIEGRRPGAKKLELFDLLKHEITSQREMILLNPRGRALDSEAAFSTIIDAYKELKSDIDESFSIAGDSTETH